MIEEYLVELSANICHSCAGIFASRFPSLFSLGLVTIPRIDSPMENCQQVWLG